jgi:hypothetical protein
MPNLEDEVAYISGLNANGSLATTSYGAYDTGSPTAVKWFATPGDNVAGTAGGTVHYYFDPGSNWTASEKQVFTDGLALWSAIANISFTLTTDFTAADVDFLRGNDGNAFTVGAYQAGGANLTQITAAVISIDTSVPGFGPITDNSFTPYAGYPWNTILHEEGHLLGLGHGGPYNGTVDPATAQYSPYDNQQYSIMSYVDPADPNAAFKSQYPTTSDFGTTSWAGGLYDNVPQTMMQADILAAQRLYGARTNGPLSGGQVFGFNTNIGGDLRPFFDFTKNTKPIVTLWDSGVQNTLDLSGFFDAAKVNLNPGTFSSAAGLTNNIAIAAGTRIDTVYTGSGNDTIIANNNGDVIDADAGNNNITGGAGNDTIYTRAGENEIDGGDGIDTLVVTGNFATYPIVGFVSGRVELTGLGGISSRSFHDFYKNLELIKFDDLTIAAPTMAGRQIGNGGRPGAIVASGGAGNDVLTGGKDNDALQGMDGTDILIGGGGVNILDGGAGVDVAEFALAPGNYYLTVNGDGSYLAKGPSETDTLRNFEYAVFDADPTKKAITFDQFAAQSFNPLNYIASYGDLIRGLGDNAAGGANHYFAAGYGEGRSTSFNPLAYVASYSDLIGGLGINQTAAADHFIKYGYYEGRGVTFNPLQYVASYSDLIVGLGDNQVAAAQHYILAGNREGRSTGTFNALQYIATNPDLIAIMGDNQTAAYEHYIKTGFYENLDTKGFNALNYVATYGDLIHGLGNNQTAAYEHFIKYGFQEGRWAQFDPVPYLLSYSDLQNAGLTAETAAAHYIDWGYAEGRSANLGFGTEQPFHALTLDTQMDDFINVPNDKDWFSIDLSAGHNYDISMSGLFAPNQLAAPLLQLRNANGVLIAQDHDSGPGTDALMHYSAAVSGTYYLVAASNMPFGTGNYGVLVQSA